MYDAHARTHAFDNLFDAAEQSDNIIFELIARSPDVCWFCTQQVAAGARVPIEMIARARERALDFGGPCPCAGNDHLFGGGLIYYAVRVYHHILCTDSMLLARTEWNGDLIDFDVRQSTRRGSELTRIWL